MKIISDTYGTWNVTTEGDCEGKSTRNLGTFTGHIDEIALHLADKCYYSLRFQKVESVTAFKPTGDTVMVSLDGIGGLNSEYRVEIMKETFKDRPVHISESNFYSAFTISTTLSEKEKLKIKREKILSKLTIEERKTLGFD